MSKIRATEFELLVSENVTDTANTEADASNSKVQNKLELSEQTKQFEETKYNLRNKATLSKEIHSNCEINTKTVTKRSLRLRRQNKEDYVNPDEYNKSKLKDIINLKREFCDVTNGLPVLKKEIKDIPSPEKISGEEENYEPVGIQSCPMKR